MLQLRPARPDDADAQALTAAVQRWYVEIYGGEDREPMRAADFAPPSGGFLIGEEDGRPVAMGGWTRLPDGDAKLRRIYVAPEARRRGYAALLVEALEEDARAAGARRAVLTTGEPQAAAVAFYRARGYADVPRFGFYADEPGAVCLGKPL